MSDPALDVREMVRVHWAELEGELGAPTSGDSDGLALGKRRARWLDDLCARVFARAVEVTGTDEPIALAAVGSFGRGAIAFRSDVDVRLLVRTDSKGRAAAARVADALLYPLWD